MTAAPLENLHTKMTTPTENPTCKHCGQSKFDHRPANYSDGVTIGQFLVCPFATFAAETETNLSGGNADAGADDNPTVDSRPSTESLGYD